MEPRSYLVVTPNGKTLRRNRSHLRSLAPAKKKVRFDDDKRIATQGTSKEQNCTKSDVAQTQSSHGQTELVTDSSVNKDKNSDLVYPHVVVGLSESHKDSLNLKTATLK